MFNNYTEANNAINNSCGVSQSFKVLNIDKVLVGDYVNDINNLPILNQFLVKGSLTYQVENGVVKHIYDNSLLNVLCDNLGNHGNARLHLYGQYRSNKIAGSVCSLNLLYYLSQDNTYKLVLYAGKLKGSNLKCYFYRELYLGTLFNVHLKTKDLCTDYLDVRNSFLENQNFDNKLDLTSYINETYNGVDFDVMFFFSTFQTNAVNNASCYRMDINKQINNLQFRINNGLWESTSVKNIDLNGLTYLHTESNSLFFYLKDYCLDLTTDGGASINRYLVRTCGAGGHFSSISTIKNMQNSKTHVTTTQQDYLLLVKLELNGQTYLGDNIICCAISLGNVTQDGFGILKSQETGEVIDDQLKILSI